ncbi:MAG: hypothetical protein IPK53_11055 [bacterium]|nr:hypothetical protein [bacterium]
MGDILESLGCRVALVNVCRQDNDLRVISFTNLAEKIFRADDPNREEATKGLLRALVEARRSDGQALLPIRVHYFFRSMLGIYACSNPKCTAVDERFRSDDRPVGKLYTQPDILCDCKQGRILELLTAKLAAKFFLGGYSVQNRITARPYFPICQTWNNSDIPNFDRNAANYALYWPNQPDMHNHDKWPLLPNRKRSKSPEQLSDLNWNRGEFKFGFSPAALQYGTARLNTGRSKNHYPTGWLYQVSVTAPDATEQLSEMPPFPIVCPRCGDDREGSREQRRLRKKLGVTDSRVTRSPIGYQVTGFAKINQVLADALLVNFPWKTANW